MPVSSVREPQAHAAREAPHMQPHALPHSASGPHAPPTDWPRRNRGARQDVQVSLQKPAKSFQSLWLLIPFKTHCMTNWIPYSQHLLPSTPSNPLPSNPSGKSLHGELQTANGLHFAGQAVLASNHPSLPPSHLPPSTCLESSWSFKKGFKRASVGFQWTSKTGISWSPPSNCPSYNSQGLQQEALQWV